MSDMMRAHVTCDVEQMTDVEVIQYVDKVSMSTREETMESYREKAIELMVKFWQEKLA